MVVHGFLGGAGFRPSTVVPGEGEVILTPELKPLVDFGFIVSPFSGDSDHFCGARHPNRKIGRVYSSGSALVLVVLF